MGQGRLKLPPKIKFWKTNINSDYPTISQSKLKRDWMDKTYNKIAYMCPPLTHATIHGWEVRLPQDVKVIWDGKWEDIDGEDSSHVQILEGDKYNNDVLAINDSGVAQITFYLNIFAETDPDHYLIFSGPPNYIFEDAYPLNFIWRSDYYNYQALTVSWKILTANKEIIFPKGMPIAFFTIYPKNLLESTEIDIYNLEDNIKIKQDVDKYGIKRFEILEKDPYDFPQLYKHGVGPNDEKFLEKPWKINLKNPNHFY